jgi:hypothetical protein
MKQITDKQKLLATGRLRENNFSNGMYFFATFMIDYFSRVKESLKMDYESFMIVQVVVTNIIYQMQKSKQKKNYREMVSLWNEIIEENNHNNITELFDIRTKTPIAKYHKLTVSSICLVTNLPKETVRRKILLLVKRKILNNNNKKGITLGEAYKKIFESFVPTTVVQISRLMKLWDKNGILKAMLDFETSDK